MAPESVEELTALFRRLGAREPESWAASQVTEGIPQLARFLFLRQAWRSILPDGETSWIDPTIAESERVPDAPFAGVGFALARLRAAGAADADVTDVARGMQAALLAAICYQLEDPGELEPEVADVGWALVQVDPAGVVLGEIGGLHESVLETDPTGREMRPPDA